MTGLATHDGDGGYERCIHCGAPAVGPCARCRNPVCGDCCVLTEGGHKTYAICTACDRRGGRSLNAGWAAVLVWIALPILALVALLLVLAAFADR